MYDAAAHIFLRNNRIINISYEERTSTIYYFECTYIHFLYDIFCNL
jgi:hypothetical protein